MQYFTAKFKQNRTKMKNILISLTFPFLLIATSCGKEKTNPIDTASLNISFKATFGGETLVLNQKSYDYLGKPVRFSKISFFISDLLVLNNDGATEISEIKFIDLTKTHGTLATAKVGTVISFSKIPVGEYNGLKFGVGVAADLNRTTPSDYSSSHPLGAGNIGEYREAWNSYIFAKIEGEYDFDSDGLDTNDIAFVYHTGTDIVYTPMELDDRRTLIAGETTNVVFELDVEQLLTLPRGDLLPLEETDPNSQAVAMRIIMNNFPKALQLK